MSPERAGVEEWSGRRWVNVVRIGLEFRLVAGRRRRAKTGGVIWMLPHSCHS